jgi:hypothetical protein
MLDCVAEVSTTYPDAVGVPYLRALSGASGAGLHEQHPAIRKRLDEVSLPCAAQNYSVRVFDATTVTGQQARAGGMVIPQSDCLTIDSVANRTRFATPTVRC